jgi:16S rRNA C1402 N4-methylase RsmH
MIRPLHVPVMLQNVIQKLGFIKITPQKKFVMLDCTLGTGAHTRALL